MPSGSEKEPVDRFRRISLSFSFTSLLTLVFLIVVAMTAAYIWGVMTGRAQSSSTSAPVVKAQEEEWEPEQGDSRILQAHELQFTQVLRSETPSPKSPPQQTVPEKSAPPQAAPEKPTPEVTPEKPAPAVREQKPAPEAPSAKACDYIYQVAALKDEQAVDSLRQKLEGYGLRTRMERSGKVYLVMVLIRGDESRAAELARITESLHLGEPLLRSRKAVMP